MKYSRVVCVLSGGGVKSAAHVGAIQALHERDLTPTHYVGTSMGAVVGACFASGLTYPEVLKRITAISRRDVAKISATMLFGPFAASVFKGDPLRDTIAALVPAREFAELEIPLTVTAVDQESGQLVLFGAAGRGQIPLMDALYASSALPVYYPPQRIGDRDYIDGGTRAVLPLDVAGEFDPDLLFAVSVGPSFDADPREKPGKAPPIVKAHDRAMRILMAAQTEEVIGRWKDAPVPLVLVRPRREQEVTFRATEVVHYVEEGYRAASYALDQWAAGS